MTPRIALAALLALPLVLSGCDRSDATTGDANPTAPAQAAPPPPSFETPQATYASALAAARREDWKTFAVCLTPEGQDQLVETSVMVAGMVLGMKNDGAAKAEFEAILERHGLPKSSEPAGAEALAAIRDKGAFVQEVFDLVGRHAKSTTENAPFIGELEDLVIDGDDAVAKVKKESNGMTMRSDIYFRRIEGEWKAEVTFGIR